MVVSSLLNVLDEIIVSFKSPRDAIGSAASESLFQHTGIVVWDSNSGDQRPWVALQHSKQRPFGAVGPDSCTKCTNSNIDGHFDSNKVKANYRFSCTSCRSSTATDTLLLGQDIVPCTVRRHLYWHPMPGRAVLRDSPGWREPGAHPAKRVKTNR